MIKKCVSNDVRWRLIKEEIDWGIENEDSVVIMTYPGAPVVELWQELVELQFADYKIVTLDLEMMDLFSSGQLEVNLNQQINANQDKKVVVGLFGGERIVEDMGISVLKWLDKLRLRKGLSLVLFYEGNLLNKQALSVFGRVPSWQSQIVVVPVYSRECVVQVIREMVKSKEYQISQTKLNEIIKLSGGLLGLVKMLLKIVNRKGWDLQSILGSIEFKLIMGELWQGLGDREREVLRKISLSEAISILEFGVELDYLEEVGFIEKSGNGEWVVAIPLLKTYIVRYEGRGRDLHISQEGRLLLDSLDVTRMFSKKERELLKWLMYKRGQLISREMLGNFLWSDNDYSDWALDARVSRLRKKLEKLGLGFRLKTKRGRGIVYD